MDGRTRRVKFRAARAASGGITQKRDRFGLKLKGDPWPLGGNVEYKVVQSEVTSLIWRDLEKASRELSRLVTEDMGAGWEPHGGVSSIATGTTVYMLQAMIKRR